MQATWSEARSLWLLDVQDVQSGQRTKWTANVFIQAAGAYNRKVIPDIPGIDTFSGDTWHTADWPEDYDFTGKTVAYVGTGATSVQALPHIQAQALSVNVFCRSMSYCQGMTNFNYPSRVKWAFRYIPGLLSLYVFIVGSLFSLWVYHALRPGTWVAKYVENGCRQHVEENVSDPALRQQLMPSGRFGAKRPLVSYAGYFKMLQKDNIKVISNPITAINESGVIVKASPGAENMATPSERNPSHETNSSTAAISLDSEHIHKRADVLIWGTGFIMQGWGGAVRTVSSNGAVLSEHWKDCPKTLCGQYSPLLFASHLRNRY